MSFLPWSGDMPLIDEAIQEGLGALASVVGQTYNVYRLTGSTNVGILSGAPVYTNFPVNIRRITAKTAIENTTFEILLYVANCDREVLQEGDMLVTEGYQSDGGVFCVVQVRPMAETILAACPLNVTITSILPTAGAASQMPTSGNVYAPGGTGWSGIWKETEQILTLVNGEYAFASSGTPAQVQVGLQPNARIRDGNSLNVPTEQYREPFIAFVPITPGVFLEEVKTRINVGNATSDRYEFTKYHTTDLVGLSGQIAMVEKLPF